MLRRCLGLAKTQLAMNACAMEEAARADRRVDELFHVVLRLAGDASGQVEVAQKAWVAYRDAHLEAMYPGPNKQQEYGSSYPMNVSLEKARLTQAQIAALERLQTRYSEK